MNAVVILWAGVAGTALTLAGVHGFLWLLDRRTSANLAFCVVAISVAGISMTELGMMHSTSPAEYGAWVRWFHLPNFLAVLGLIAFVRLEFGTGRLWLATTSSCCEACCSRLTSRCSRTPTGARSRACVR